MLISMLCLQNHLFAMAQQHITFLSIWGKNDDLKWLIFLWNPYIDAKELIISKILRLFAEELLRYGHKKQKHFCIYQLIHASNLMKAIIVLKSVY